MEALSHSQLSEPHEWQYENNETLFFSSPVTAVVVGYGNRGSAYAKYALERPDLLTIVGIAEPRKYIREAAARKHNLPLPPSTTSTTSTEVIMGAGATTTSSTKVIMGAGATSSSSSSSVFCTWQELVATGKRLADAVIICTQDRDHTAPSIALAALGYHILLEKPMAPSKKECEMIHDAVTAQGNILFAVGHVLRYTPYMQTIIRLLRSGAIGDVINIQHLEPIGHAHFAHSFVRGNWRREDESSFLLMAKTCHDIDLLRYMMNKPCKSVSSFGNLSLFKNEKKPEGAGQSKRCIECPVEEDCCWSSQKIYREQAVKTVEQWKLAHVEASKQSQKGVAEPDIEDIAAPAAAAAAASNTSVPLAPLPPLTFTWPVHVLLDGEHSLEAVDEALRVGPYGRCVWECDNDVMDHQIVAMQFEGGATATLTTTAFTELVCQRQTRIFGTRGELTCTCDAIKGDAILQFDFLTRKTTTYSGFHAPAGTALVGHGGADYFLIWSFVRAVGIATGVASTAPLIVVDNEKKHIPEMDAKQRFEKAAKYILSGPSDTLESHLMVFESERARIEGKVVQL